MTNTPPPSTKKARRIAEVVLAVALVAVAGGLIVVFFERLWLEGSTGALPGLVTCKLAIDWRGLYRGIAGATLEYGGTGLRNPPWSLLPVLPLGLFSFSASWGLLTMLTLIVLLVSIPRVERRILWATGTLLLVTSFPAMRHAADGNLEGLVIAGVLLAIFGYDRRNPWALAGGLLLATAKIQETWLFLMVLLVCVLRTWPSRRWITAGLASAVVVAPCMLWRGSDWLRALLRIVHRGSIMDCSLAATAGRLNLPPILFGAVWVVVFGITAYSAIAHGRSLAREKAGLLIAASLLLSPYSAGNSFLTVLAIGVIPLFQASPWVGLGLIALANLPYLALSSAGLLFWWQANYFTALLLVTWAVLVWRRWRRAYFSPGATILF